MDVLTSYRVNSWERPHRWMVSIGLTASRQKWLLFTVNRQKCRLILIVQKFQGISILLFFSISADHHGLLAPEESSSTLENQFPCSQKHPF